MPKLKITFPGGLSKPGAAPGTPGGAPPPPIPRAKRRRPKKLVLIGGAAAVVLLLGGVYFVWLKPEPPPPPLVARPKPVAPPAGAAKPASLPGKMVDKAQTTAAKGAAVIDNSGGLLDQRPSGAPPVSNAAAKAARAPEEMMATTQAPIAPGISATNTKVMVTAEASPAFRTWAANAKIAGVIPGRVPPRAVINSRAVDAGEIIDDALGIFFDSVDAERKTIIFRDKSGAKVSIKY